MLRGHWSLLKKFPAIILTTLLIGFFTGYGQTILLATFSPIFQSDLGIGNLEISSLYSISTFIAAIVAPLIGKRIDQHGAKTMMIALLLILAAGFSCMGMAQHLWTLGLGYFLVRGAGQAALGLTVTTFISKNFGQYRGRALVFPSIGRALCDGTMPILVVFMTQTQGISTTLFALAGSFLLAIVVVSLFMPQKASHPYFSENAAVEKVRAGSRVFNYNLKKSLRVFWVWPLFLASTTMPLVLTGLFFQQKALLEMKQWTQGIWASAFSLYAIAHIVFNFIAGVMVDKFSASRLIGWALFPFVCGMVALEMASNSTVLFAIFFLFGASVGLHANIKNAFFAELFGPLHLAEIKSASQALSMSSTALAPTVLAVVLAANIGFDDVLEFLVGYSSFALVCYALASYKLSSNKKFRPKSDV
jgi:MFS family permease